MSVKKVLGIIPARYASTRFLGKPLVEIAGKSMIQRVYEQANKAQLLNEVIVATDDSRILEHVLAFGGQALMTATTHQSGTDRCAEIAALKTDFNYIVNIQGDEPFIAPSQIDLIIQVLQENSQASIATLVKKITNPQQLLNTNIVKAVFNQKMEALYFSRQAIPFQRGKKEVDWLNAYNFYKHIGMYAYEKNTLIEIAQLPQSQLEIAESLEQLRWLDHGYTIGIGLTDIESLGIDVPEDLERLLKTKSLPKN